MRALIFVAVPFAIAWLAIGAMYAEGDPAEPQKLLRTMLRVLFWPVLMSRAQR